MLQLFINYLLSMVGESLYVWSGQGESLKTMFMNWVRKVETSDANVKRVQSLLDKKMKDDIFAFDCSGLGVNWLLQKKLIKVDMTANSMYNLCTPVTKSQLKRGDWVFIRNANGIKTHIGYIVDDNLNVVECAGRDYGTIRRPLSQGSPNGAWTDFGRPESIFPELKSVKEENKVAEISRVLKLTDPRMKGDDVKALQRAVETTDDGVFGPNTETKVKEAQKRLGLNVDGKAGKDTTTALGLVWRG
ncbi:MAG TPA: hypothetical protein DHW61_16065 [Lachnoclostridium phytofermentans]|uniref:Peptidoglycan-binding domain 1 protein n=1 Tax=Lachnoclostridium phytofermentans TaxID=66219 RepID=A0A3D2XA89_9FIRM|nr:peptidoglycan-binding protein [Lachnoclostridium sp.]HCL03896.1 hypothetical protein [Lachnoclostridium phytofermentans]